MFVLKGITTYASNKYEDLLYYHGNYFSKNSIFKNIFYRLFRKHSQKVNFRSFSNNNEYQPLNFSYFNSNQFLNMNYDTSQLNTYLNEKNGNVNNFNSKFDFKNNTNEKNKKITNLKQKKTLENNDNNLIKANYNNLNNKIKNDDNDFSNLNLKESPKHYIYVDENCQDGDQKLKDMKFSKISSNQINKIIIKKTNNKHSNVFNQIEDFNISYNLNNDKEHKNINLIEMKTIKENTNIGSRKATNSSNKIDSSSNYNIDINLNQPNKNQELNNLYEKNDKRNNISLKNNNVLLTESKSKEKDNISKYKSNEKYFKNKSINYNNNHNIKDNNFDHPKYSNIISIEKNFEELKDKNKIQKYKKEVKSNNLENNLDKIDKIEKQKIIQNKFKTENNIISSTNNINQKITYEDEYDLENMIKENSERNNKRLISKNKNFQEKDKNQLYTNNINKKINNNITQGSEFKKINSHKFENKNFINKLPKGKNLLENTNHKDTSRGKSNILKHIKFNHINPNEVNFGLNSRSNSLKKDNKYHLRETHIKSNNEDDHFIKFIRKNLEITKKDNIQNPQQQQGSSNVNNIDLKNNNIINNNLNKPYLNMINKDSNFNQLLVNKKW